MDAKSLDDTPKTAVLAEKPPRKPETGMIGVFSFNHEFPFEQFDPTRCEVQGRQLTGHVLSLRVLFVADLQTSHSFLYSLYFARKSCKHTEMGRESGSYICYVLKYAFYGTLVLIKRLLC